MDEYASLPDDLIGSSKRWQEWMELERPEDEPLPGMTHLPTSPAAGWPSPRGTIHGHTFWDASKNVHVTQRLQSALWNLAHLSYSIEAGAELPERPCSETSTCLYQET